ncbi:MAG TPA: hypothetical protein VNU28_05530, partial [Solirubrobacteraceae bacterium]|nr:hypothetical protein [Solirubrobacteraceae bacterium]
MLVAFVLGTLAGTEDPGDTPPAPFEELRAYSPGRASLRGYWAAAGYDEPAGSLWLAPAAACAGAPTQIKAAIAIAAVPIDLAERAGRRRRPTEPT